MRVGQTAQQFAKAGVTAGLWTPDEVKSWWESLPADQRSKDGETFAAALVAGARITRFQADELLTGSSTPLVLGEYVLQARIGAGGMGQVFKARHRRMKRFAAIKLLPTALTQNEAAIKRFEREVEAAAKLSHPNIVQTHDAGVQQSVWYLVMEYVEGCDLSAVVATQSPLPVAVAVDYIRQAAKGLAYAHKSGVVHRDIKPANLLLDKEGTIKILDMGLARFEDPAAAKDGLTESGLVMGTVDYMAPEQAFDVHTADARADIYSLGCTLYRLLTNRNVYEAESLVQKLLSHQNKPVPALAAHRSDVPASLVAIFERMVAKRPEERFQTMTEVEAALTNCNQSIAASSSQKPDADSKLTSFFRSITGAKTATPATATPAATVSLAKAAVSLEVPEILPTVNLSNPLQGTDPVSERSVQMVREATPHPAVLEHKKVLPRPFWIAAGLSGVLLLLLGLWVVISDKNGSEVGRTKAPEVGLAASQTTKNATGQAIESTRANYALQLDDGQTARIESVSFDAGQDLTIEAFVRVESRTDTQILALGDYRMVLDNQSGVFSLVIGEKKVSGGATNSALPLLGRRVHLAFVKHRTPGTQFAQYTMFTDGKQSGGRSGDYAPTDKTLGLILGGVGPVVVDEVRISTTRRYHVNRKPQEFTPPERLEADDDTLALYHFDEGQGDVLVDSSGHGHHGKIVGAKWVQVQVDYALHFDQAECHVEVPSLKLEEAIPVTVECYVTPRYLAETTDFGTAGPIMRSSADNTEYSLYLHAQKRLAFARTNRGQAITPPDSLLPNQRIHVAGVWDGKAVSLYVNGKRFPDQGSTSGLTKFKNSTFRIGSYGPGSTKWFNGIIDEMHVSQTVRYTNEFTPAARFLSDTNTLALYHFDEGQGDVLVDSSGHGHHGKIVGAKWIRADGSPIETPPKGKNAPPPAKAPLNAQEARAHQEAWAKHLGLPVEKEITLAPSAKLKMILIPPGEFLMGSSAEELAQGPKRPPPWINGQSTASPAKGRSDWCASQGPFICPHSN